MNKIAQLIVHIIIQELLSKSGFNHWWFEIDLDIRDEIKTTLTKKVTKVVDEAMSKK